MSVLTASAYTATVFTTKEENRKYLPLHNYWQNESDQVDNTVYLGNYLTTAAISGGNIASLSSPVPTRTNKYGNPFNYINPVQPLVSKNGALLQRVSATGAASGREWTNLPILSVNANDFISIVTKNSVTSGTITFRFGSDSTNYYTYTLTASAATAAGYAPYSFRIGSGTATGTPVLTSMKYFAVIGSAAMDIDPYCFSTANNPSNFIGSRHTSVFDCLTDLAMESAMEKGEIACFNYIERKVTTKGGFKITVKQNQISMKNEAATGGETLKRDTLNTRVILNSSTEGAKATIASGIITLATGLSVYSIANVTLSSGPNAGTVLNLASNVNEVNESTYFYNSTTGVMTFDSTHNGVIPFVEQVTQTTGTTYLKKNLKTGAVGNLILQRETQDGKTEIYEFFNAEASDSKRNNQDTNIEGETTFEVYPIVRGSDRVWFQYSII